MKGADRNSPTTNLKNSKPEPDREHHYQYSSLPSAKNTKKKKVFPVSAPSPAPYQQHNKNTVPSLFSDSKDEEATNNVWRHAETKYRANRRRAHGGDRTSCGCSNSQCFQHPHYSSSSDFQGLHHSQHPNTPSTSRRPTVVIP